jgi:DNA-directed RNA polymerase omega subunit
MKNAHEISTEELCEKIPNKFQMILMVSLRARELSRNKTPNPIAQSLTDLIDGKIDRKILDKLKDKKVK